MSSVLHAVLTALLWLSMAVCDARAAGEPAAHDDEAHVLRGGAPGPAHGLVREAIEEDERENSSPDDDLDDADTRSPPLAPHAGDPLARHRSAPVTRPGTIPMTGAGCIRGPPSTCPFGHVPQFL